MIFLGSRQGFEGRLVPERGYRLESIAAAPLFGVGMAAKVRALGVAALGTAQVRRILRREGTQLVLGLGGYASFGAVAAAATLGIPSVLHEANAVAGVANGVLGRFVDRVLLGFDSAAATFPRGKTLVTGTPVRDEILGAGQQVVRRGGPERPLRVLVSGGSTGSPFLNLRVPELLGRVRARGHAVTVRHQAGTDDVEATRAAYAQQGVPAVVVSYIDDMGEAYASADVAVVCAGGVTLAELAVVGVPAVIVPLASAALDHQVANARAFGEMSGARWYREVDWDPEAIATSLVDMIVSPGSWGAASARTRGLGRPGAADAVVQACETLIAASRHRRRGPFWVAGTRAP